jgi:hypothetical protein
MLPILLIGGVVGSLAVLGGGEYLEGSIWKVFKDVGTIGLTYLCLLWLLIPHTVFLTLQE